MREVPSFILERTHRLKLAARGARERSDAAGVALLELQKQLVAAETHLASANTSGSGETRPDVIARAEQRRADLQKQIAELEPQIETQSEIAKRASEFDIAVTAVYERCANWLDFGLQGKAALEAIEIAIKGDPAKRLAELNVEIANLGEQRERIAAAPTARVDIEHAVRNHLTKIRAQAEPKITVDAHGNVDITLGAVGRKVDLANYPSQKVTQQSLLALALWLDGDKVEQQVLQITDRFPISKDALPAAAKQQKLIELEAKQSAALYEMGAVVREAIEQGTAVPVSKALTAEHLLGVTVKRATAVAA